MNANTVLKAGLSPESCATSKRERTDPCMEIRSVVSFTADTLFPIATDHQNRNHVKGVSLAVWQRVENFLASFVNHLPFAELLLFYPSLLSWSLTRAGATY